MSNNIKVLVRENIRNLKGYSSARDEYTGRDAVFLDANENPYGNFNRYPDPNQQELKTQLASIKKVAAENIFIGNGSDEVIDLAFRIFCEPARDAVLFFTPTYGMYQVVADINKVAVINIPLNEQFQIDESLLQPYLELDNLKMIIICSPNNPSGNLMDSSVIESILQKFKGIVLIDEAYIDFCAAASFVKRLHEFPRLIICQTLSKAWAMAGFRIGVALMNVNLCKIFNKVKPPYNISKLNQEQAVKLLNDKATYLENIQKIMDQKNWLLAELKNLKFVLKVYPTEANFFLMQVKDATRLYDYLVKNGVVIRNRDIIIKNCVRISIGTPIENEILLKYLKTF